jgi:hypothetical protein
VEVVTKEFAGVAGKVQIKTAGARSESWLWLPGGTGTVGADFESGDDFAAQQGIVTPCWQHTCIARFAHAGDGAWADRNGFPASTKLQIMTNITFTI